MAVARRPSGRLATGLLLLITLGLWLPSAPLGATAALSPDLALRQLLARAHAEATRSCTAPADRLVAILCAGTLRVGVRDDYPPFAIGDATGRDGFEIAVARRIAQALGVTASFVTVSPADRIALLAENRIDLTIATMGDTTLRDSQARFVRPHYYASHTEVIGSRQLPIHSLAAIGGRTICVTVGDSSNPGLAAAGGRLLLFATPDQLIDELHSGACALIAQDDTYLARHFALPQFRALYEAKFAVDPLPWGMAAPLAGGGQLATALSLISQIFHRDGVFLALARAYAVPAAFLAQQQSVWQRPVCNTAQGHDNPDCVLPPRRSNMTATAFARQVNAAETWLDGALGLHLRLDIFKLQPAWDLVREGMRTSLILIIGTLASTLAFTLLIGHALSARTLLLRWPVRGIVMLLQSTPPVLSLVIAAAAANAVFAFSATLAIGAAIFALGLINGGNAGQAVSEAVASLRTEQAGLPAATRLSKGQIYAHALGRSMTQIMAFLINATKATPIASFIGAPELLNALTDSTSFSSDRETTYWLMLIFYVVAVLLVVWLCGITRRMLERRLSRI